MGKMRFIGRWAGQGDCAYILSVFFCVLLRRLSVPLILLYNRIDTNKLQCSHDNGQCLMKRRYKPQTASKTTSIPAGSPNPNIHPFPNLPTSQSTPNQMADSDQSAPMPKSPTNHYSASQALASIHSSSSYQNFVTSLSTNPTKSNTTYNNSTPQPNTTTSTPTSSATISRTSIQKSNTPSSFTDLISSLSYIHATTNSIPKNKTDKLPPITQQTTNTSYYSLSLSY